MKRLQMYNVRSRLSLPSLTFTNKSLLHTFNNKKGQVLGGRRVVVTGLGLVSPLGTDPSEVWDKLVQGETGIKTITDPSILATEIPVKVSAPVDGFKATDWVPRSASMVTSRFEAFAIAAASIAMKDSNWQAISDESRERAGVTIGSGIGCVEETSSAGQTLANRGSRKLSAYTLPKMLSNLAAGQVSIMHNLQGPNHCVATACATGAHSIGDAYRFIKYGDADMMVAGGTESGVSPLSMALFSRIHALSRQPNPTCASQPFAGARDGFVMGEGAGVIILEELDAALERGAKIYAEIVGYGLSSDAHHVTSPPEGGRGAYLSMRNALLSANITPHDIGYINCHATSTLLGDNAELSAIRHLFLGRKAYAPSDSSTESLEQWLVTENDAEQAYSQEMEQVRGLSDYIESEWDALKKFGPLISSTKGSTGHSLGAAGAIEAIFTIMSLYHGTVPPTLGVLENPENVPLDGSSSPSKYTIDPRFYDLRIVCADTGMSKRTITKEYAMTNSFGFGGSNTSLVFKKFNGF